MTKMDSNPSSEMKHLFVGLVLLAIVPFSEAKPVGAAEYYKFVNMQCDKVGKLALVARKIAVDGATLDDFMATFDRAVSEHLGALSARDRDMAEAVGDIVINSHAKVSPEIAGKQIEKQCRAHPESFSIYP